LPLFPELEHERDAAERVKRKVPILVVLGNPPYNAFAGTSPEEEHGLVDVYKEGLVKKWGIKKFNLDEFYVRFMRLAQRRITEGTKQGIVCYISSFSYLADPSFVVMRQRLLNDFDNIWIDCLNGDSRETGKKTPTGEPDPSVFSTKQNTAGIRLGTSIGLFTRKLGRNPWSLLLPSSQLELLSTEVARPRSGISDSISSPLSERRQLGSAAMA
jgi:predicted helicase